MLLNMLRLEEADPSMMVKQSFLQAGQHATWHATSHTTRNVACNIAHNMQRGLQHRTQHAMWLATYTHFVRTRQVLSCARRRSPPI
jgi:hypothetical protein